MKAALIEYLNLIGQHVFHLTGDDPEVGAEINAGLQRTAEALGQHAVDHEKKPKTYMEREYDKAVIPGGAVDRAGKEAEAFMLPVEECHARDIEDGKPICGNTGGECPTPACAAVRREGKPIPDVIFRGCMARIAEGGQIPACRVSGGLCPSEICARREKPDVEAMIHSKTIKHHHDGEDVTLGAEAYRLSFVQVGFSLGGFKYTVESTDGATLQAWKSIDGFVTRRSLPQGELAEAIKNVDLPRWLEDLIYSEEIGKKIVKGTCRVCGCTDERACAGGCTWADEEQHTLCSNCVEAFCKSITGDEEKDG